MKKNFRILLMSALLFIMSALSFSSCENDNMKKTAIILSGNTFTISGEGGDIELPYSIENPIDGIKLKAETDADWIKDIKVSDDRISYYSEPNMTGEAREAVMSLVYDKINLSVKIIQEMCSATDDAFRIVINEVGTNSVIFSTYPKDQEMVYDVTVWGADYFDSLGDEKVWDMIIARYEAAAQIAGLSLEEYISQDTKNLKKGNLEKKEVGDLYSEMKCYVVAVGIGPKGDKITEFNKEAFTTKAPENIDMTFELSVELNENDGTKAMLHAKPSNDENPYYMTYARSIDLERVQFTPEEYADFIIEAIIEMYTGFGLDRETILGMILQYGESEVEASGMNLETRNTFIAVATDENGNITSKATTLEFTTPDAPDSDNEFTVTLSNINVDRFDIDVKVTNSDSYGIIVDTASRYNEGMSETEILETLQYYDLIKITTSGDFNNTYIGLKPSSEYYVFVLGVYGNAATTSVWKQKITTLPEGNVADFEFDAEITEIAAHGAKVKTLPSPQTILYIWGVSNASATKDDIKSIIDKAYEENKINYGSKQEFMQNYGTRGSESKEISGLFSNTGYKIYAACIDDKTGEIADVLFSEEFKTNVAELSDATIKMEFDKYWDVDELAEKYPSEFGEYSYQGLYCMPMTVVTTGEPTVTYFAVLEGDITDKEEYSDEQITLTLIYNGNGSNASSAHMLMKYDTDLTVVAVAEDVNGNFSAVYRCLVNKSVDGKSPVDEYVMPNGMVRENVESFRNSYHYVNICYNENAGKMMKTVISEERGINDIIEYNRIKYDGQRSESGLMERVKFYPVELL